MMTELGALRIADRARWEARVAGAMRKAGGKIEPAAAALGVSKRQLQRWLDELPDVARAPPGRPWADAPKRARKKKK